MSHRPSSDSENSTREGPALCCSAQERPSETFPPMVGSPGLREGRGRSQSHMAYRWDLHILSYLSLLTKSLRGLGASFWARFRGSSPHLEAWMRLGGPDRGQCGCVSPALLCLQGVREQQLGDPLGLQGRRRHVRVHGSQPGWDRTSKGSDRRHRSVPLGPS